MHKLTFQCNDFADRVHDGGVGGDGAPDGVSWVGHVNNDHLNRTTSIVTF